MPELLLRTMHVSWLYNLNHAGSDMDFYEVYSGKGRAKQTIVDGIDTVRISYDYFMHQCQKGVPQALEALYSQEKTVDKIPFITKSFNPTNTEVYKTYVRTIKNFWAHSDLKRKRHAIRLSINLSDIKQYGKFNPSTSLIERSYINIYSEIDTDECPGLDMLGFPLYTW